MQSDGSNLEVCIWKVAGMAHAAKKACHSCWSTTERERERDLHAKRKGCRQAQHTKFSLHVHQQRGIEWMHPIRGVLGTFSPVSKFLCACGNVESSPHRVPSVNRAANWSSAFWQPLQCSRNPSPGKVSQHRRNNPCSIVEAWSLM